MTNQEKRILRLLRGQKDVKFHEIKTILEGIGYRLTRITGSHHIFKHGIEKIMILPVHENKIKTVYLRSIILILKKYYNEKKL